jgi:hypothetical protein
VAAVTQLIAGEKFGMRVSVIRTLLLLMACFSATAVLAQDNDHVEIGVFADYFNLSHPTPNINFVGVGGRAAFNVRSNVQIEAEMAYDFQRNFTTTTNNGISTNFIRTSTRPLHALFGPKIETSGGGVRFFGTFKAGLINFSSSSQNLTGGFQSGLSEITTGNTSAAIYPGVGLEGFIGWFGLRADVGDEMYFSNGTHHNIRATFGPTFRF